MECRHFATACLLALLVTPLQAAVYTWTDAEGKVHFSDRPTHESAQEKKLPKSNSPSGGQAIPSDRKQLRQRMLDVYEQERAEKREAKAKEKQAREERKQQCLSARVDYENYRNSGSIYELNEDGSRRYMEKQEREDYIARLKAKVDQYCK